MVLDVSTVTPENDTLYMHVDLLWKVTDINLITKYQNINFQIFFLILWKIFNKVKDHFNKN